MGGGINPKKVRRAHKKLNVLTRPLNWKIITMLLRDAPTMDRALNVGVIMDNLKDRTGQPQLSQALAELRAHGYVARLTLGKYRFYYPVTAELARVAEIAGELANCETVEIENQ